LSRSAAANPQDGWGTPPPSPKSPPKVVRLRLDTSRDCQRALARLIRGTLAGTVETQDLSRYANAIAVLARLIEGGDIERRLEELEAKTVR